MKKHGIFVMAQFLLFTLLLSCNNPSENKETKDVPVSGKVTDIPATTKSKDALAAFNEGLAFYDLNDMKKARASFTKAIELDPKFGLAYLFRANTSQTAKDYADDIANGKANLDSSSAWEKMHAEFLGTNLTGDRNRGIEIAQKIATDYPDAARAQLDLGLAYEGNNQFGKAREAYTKAIEVNPSWPTGYSLLSNSYLFYDPKDMKKAEQNALKVVELAPKSSGAQIMLGDCYRAQNDLQKAKAAYTKAVELDPGSPGAYYKLGHANTYLGNYEDARRNYMDAEKRDEAKTGALLNIANTYLYAGELQAATGYLMNEILKKDNTGASPSRIATEKNNLISSATAIAIHNNDAATLKKLVAIMKPYSEQVNADLGNTTEIKIFAKADSLHWQAMIAMLEGRLDNAKAIEELMKAALDPIKDGRKLEGYYYDLGQIAMREKKYTDAIADFEKSNPNDIYNKYMLAKANEAAGNKEKAIALYKEVSAYNFNDIGNALVRAEVKKKMQAIK